MYLKSKKILWKKVSRKVYIHCTLYYVCFLEYTEDGYEQMFQVNYETPSIKKEKKNVPRSLCLNIEKNYCYSLIVFWRVNYLGHFLLVSKLLPIMLDSGDDCRIIMVSSSAHVYRHPLIWRKHKENTIQSKKPLKTIAFWKF